MPSMGTDKMPVRPGRPCAAMAMATRLMAETGMMMPASGSDGSCWSKVAEMQQLRMPPHERQWSTTLLPLSRSRTPPSRSQHLHSCTLEDRVAARISLLGRGCGALGAERGNKTSERLNVRYLTHLDLEPATAHWAIAFKKLLFKFSEAKNFERGSPLTMHQNDPLYNKALF